MYIWEADSERLADLATRFHLDTARANIFRARRTQSALLTFTGADAVGYFKTQFQHDAKQAMALAGVLMSAGVFLAIDNSQEFVNSENE